MDVEGFGPHLDPFTSSPADLLRSAADMEPGPFLMGILLMVDRATLDPDDAVTYLQLHASVASWWAALEADAMVAAAGTEPRMAEFLVLDPRPDHHEERVIQIEEAVREEVACALRLTTPTAQRRIDRSRLLAGPLSATQAALSRGEITLEHAAAITDEAGRLGGRYATDQAVAAAFADACRRLESRVLPTARRGTVARTKVEARKVASLVDPAAQEARRRSARASRDVWVMDDDDGLSTLLARLDSLTAHALMAAVADAAGAPSLGAPCGSTAGERRALALAELVLHSTSAHDASASDQPLDRPVSGARVGVTIDVVVSLSDLLGLTADTAPVDGVGGARVSVADLRALLDDPTVPCSLRRLVTDPVTGHVIDVGRRRYEVTGPLRALIVARDRTCRFPGCGRRAVNCQIDHALAWEDGGRTDAANLGALCVRHHQLKTHGGWQLTESSVDGGCEWTSPHGRNYARRPEPVGSRQAPGAPEPVPHEPEPPPF